MDRRKNALDLKKKMGKDLELYLRREYEENRVGQKRLAKKLGVSKKAIQNWLNKFNIRVRALSESKLSEDAHIPTKEDLVRSYYVERLSLSQIAEKCYVSKSLISRLFKEHGLKLMSNLERRNILIPSKKELEELYKNQRKNTYMISEELGLSRSLVNRLLIVYKIPMRTSSRFEEKELMELIEKDATLRDLTAVAISLNGHGQDIEKIILDLYKGKFKDARHLHDLLEKNEQEIRNLITEGRTNLGSYLGNYLLQARTIKLMLVDQAIEVLPQTYSSPSLEETLSKMIVSVYEPEFNQDPTDTLSRLEQKALDSDNDIKRTSYRKSRDYFSRTLSLMEAIENARVA